MTQHPIYLKLLTLPRQHRHTNTNSSLIPRWMIHTQQGHVKHIMHTIIQRWEAQPIRLGTYLAHYLKGSHPSATKLLPHRHLYELGG